MEQKDKVQICKVVAQAILADGQLTDSERDFLETLMTTYGLSDDEKSDVMVAKTSNIIFSSHFLLDEPLQIFCPDPDSPSKPDCRDHSSLHQLVSIVPTYAQGIRDTFTLK